MLFASKMALKVLKSSAVGPPEATIRSASRRKSRKRLSFEDLLELSTSLMSSYNCVDRWSSQLRVLSQRSHYQIYLSAEAMPMVTTRTKRECGGRLPISRSKFRSRSLNRPRSYSTCRWILYQSTACERFPAFSQLLAEGLEFQQLFLPSTTGYIFHSEVCDVGYSFPANGRDGGLGSEGECRCWEGWWG